jgi:hypothetical protein
MYTQAEEKLSLALDLVPGDVGILATLAAMLAAPCVAKAT